MISVESILKHKPQFRGSMIDGVWRRATRASETWDVISPANLDWVLPPAHASFDDGAAAVRAARKAFRPWAETKLSLRTDMLRALARELNARRETLAQYMALESGKPLDECAAEVQALLGRIEITLEDALPLVATVTRDGAQIVYRPKGVLLVIGPSVLSLSVPHGHIVPALLMGNVIVFKPSEKAVYTAQIYAEAMEAAGFPPGVFQLVQGTGEQGRRLVRESDVDGVLATCSLEVGTQIQRELAGNPETLVALSMGGKNAALVLPGANLDHCADELVRAAFGTTGQRCTALSRVFVAPDLMPALVERVHRRAKELIISQPFERDPAPFMGPLVSLASKERFLRYNSIAESEGAELVMRPKALEGTARQSRRPLPAGHYVSPAITVVPRWDARSAYQTHEILGPDLFFCALPDEEEMLAAANATGYGLAGAIFGGDDASFTRLADRWDVGMLYRNRGTVGASPRWPFAGWKKSGNHHAAGIFAIYAVSQIQLRA